MNFLRQRRSKRFFLTLGAFFIFGSCSEHQDLNIPLSVGCSDYNYDQDISLILNSRCTSCHGNSVQKAGLNLARYESNRPDRWGRVLSVVQSKTMPPPGNPQLSQAELNLIQNWVGAGAPQTAELAKTGCVNSCKKNRIPTVSPLRRLSKWELVNSIRELFGNEVLASVSIRLGELPEEDVSEMFDKMHLNLSFSQVAAFFEIADEVAIRVTDGSVALAALDSCLAQSLVTNPCIQKVVANWGLKIYRRPLKPEELSSYSNLYESVTASLTPLEGLRAIFSSLLQAPDFLYHLENHGELLGSRDQIYYLSAYDLASRLSFFAWGRSPDALLFKAAASGALLTPPGLHEQVDRIFSDERAKDHVEHFYSEWLHFSGWQEFDGFTSVSYSKSFLDNISVPHLVRLRQAMKQEGLDFVNWVTWTKKGSYADLMTSSYVATLSSELASVYGVTNGSTTVANGLRNGLLTRGIFLATTGTENESPIHRGALIRESMMCGGNTRPDPTDFPPDTLTEPVFDVHLSTRERWESKTNSASCMSCHASINAFGFALGNYDAIGRYRTQEKIFQNDKIVNSLPINSSVSPPIETSSDPVVVGAGELGRALAESPKANRCFSQQWFRFATGRKDSDLDRCLIDDLHDVLKGGGDIITMMKKLALVPEFRLLKVE